MGAHRNARVSPFRACDCRMTAYGAMLVIWAIGKCQHIMHGYFNSGQAALLGLARPTSCVDAVHRTQPAAPNPGQLTCMHAYAFMSFPAMQSPSTLVCLGWASMGKHGKQIVLDTRQPQTNSRQHACISGRCRGARWTTISGGSQQSPAPAQLNAPVCHSPRIHPMVNLSTTHLQWSG